MYASFQELFSHQASRERRDDWPRQVALFAATIKARIGGMDLQRYFVYTEGNQQTFKES
jgi:hypothetical protein